MISVGKYIYHTWMLSVKVLFLDILWHLLFLKSPNFLRFGQSMISDYNFQLWLKWYLWYCFEIVHPQTWVGRFPFSWSCVFKLGGWKHHLPNWHPICLSCKCKIRSKVRLDHHGKIRGFMDFCWTFIQSFMLSETYHINSNLGTCKIMMNIYAWFDTYCYILYTRFLFNSMWWNKFVTPRWPIQTVHFTRLVLQEVSAVLSWLYLSLAKMKFCLMNIICCLCYLGTFIL